PNHSPTASFPSKLPGFWMPSMWGATSTTSGAYSSIAQAKSPRLVAAYCSRTTSMSASDTLGGRAGADQVGELLQRAQVLLGVAVHRRNDDPVRPRVGEARDSL